MRGSERPGVSLWYPVCVAHILLFPLIIPCGLAIRRIPCSPIAAWSSLSILPGTSCTQTQLCSSCLGLWGGDGGSCCWVLLSKPPKVINASLRPAGVGHAHVRAGGSAGTELPNLCMFLLQLCFVPFSRQCFPARLLSSGK